MRVRPNLRAACWFVLPCAALTATLYAADFEEAKIALLRPRCSASWTTDKSPALSASSATPRVLPACKRSASCRLDANEAMPKDALFRIASMTKPITAVGVLILADEGKLKVNDAVEKHLPEFRGQWLIAESRRGSIGVDEACAANHACAILLTHTSGLSNYPPGLGESSWQARSDIGRGNVGGIAASAAVRAGQSLVVQQLRHRHARPRHRSRFGEKL